MMRTVIAAGMALALASGLSATHGDSTDSWRWPLEPRNIARAFEQPPHPWSAGHRGIDISGDQGSTIVAVADGTVHFSGTIVNRGSVSISHGDSRTITSYEPVTPLVARGDRVHAGQTIALLEGVHTGCGSCLHFGVRVDGEYQDPMTWLTLERPVLLPIADELTNHRPVRHADARSYMSSRACRTTRECISAWCRDWRDPRAPAPP